VAVAAAECNGFGRRTHTHTNNVYENRVISVNVCGAADDA